MIMIKIGHRVSMLATSESNPRNGEGTFILRNDGSIVYAYSRYIGNNYHDHEPADIYGITSYDNGESWSDPFLILGCDKSSKNYMCPSFLRLANGDIGLFYLRKFTIEGQAAILSEMCLVRSSDEGKTWSEPVSCTSGEIYYVFENDHAIMLRCGENSGRIILPLNIHSRTENGVISNMSKGIMCFFASDDDGKSWYKLSAAHSICNAPYSSSGLQETAVYEHNDGMLRALSRTDQHAVIKNGTLGLMQIYNDHSDVKIIDATIGRATGKIKFISIDATLTLTNCNVINGNLSTEGNATIIAKNVTINESGYYSDQCGYECVSGSLTLDGVTYTESLEILNYHTHTDANGDCICDREDDACHSGTLVPTANGDGTHNVVCDLCHQTVTENVACTPANPDRNCVTPDACACGYAVQGLAAHTLSIKSDKNDTDHILECTNEDCDYEEDEAHTFDQSVAESKYLKSEANCVSGATYYKSCECGHKSTETFVSGDTNPDNHDFNTTDVCSRCNAVKISEKTFPDANFRNFLLNDVETHYLNGDGVFTQEEIAKITYLPAMSVRMISDLTGIEYFTELTTLNISSNNLKSIDLSKNIKLTEVELGEQAWAITLEPDATFDLNTLGIDVSKLTLPEGCTVDNGIIKFEADVYDLSGLTYPSGYGDTLFRVRLAIENPHTHASVETFDDCSKEEVCLCGDITKAAKAHTPEDDDGDCTTDILCSVCDAVATKGNEAHTGGIATCTAQAVCTACGTSYGSTLAHTPEADDGDCTTAIRCSVCDDITTSAKSAHDFSGDYLSDEAGHWHKCENCEATDTKVAHDEPIDDNNCTTAVLCSCGYTLIPAKSHGFDNACDTDCNNADCTHTRVTSHTPNEDDGDCTTEIRCSICNAVTTEAKSHSFDNNCDTTCNNTDCDYTRTISHTPNEDDGDCTTAIHCSICNAVTTEAKSHIFDNDGDTTCNNSGCEYTRTISHTPNEDDGDCTTEIRCSVCGEITTAARSAHTGGTATCQAKAQCEVCGKEYGDMLEHTYTVPQNDTTHHWNKCSACDAIDEKVKHSGTDDGDCTTAVTCSCGYTITAANASHSGGAASCTKRAECSACGTKYGSTLAHSYTVPQHNETQHWNKCATCDDTDTKVNHNGVATCTAKAHCTVCDIDHGEPDATNHAKNSFLYTANADGTTHTKKHECCLALVTADEAHTFGEDDKCVCGTAKPVPTYTVTVENGTVGEGNTSIVVNENGSVTVSADEAPEGKEFKGWSVNGEIVSTDETYTFNATEDIELKAVYEDISSGSEDTPSTGEDTPSTGDDTPSTGDDTHSTGDDTPSTGDDTHSTGDDTPSTGDDTPSTGDDTPSTDDDAPSTGDTDVTPIEPGDYEDGLSGGAVTVIVISSVVVLGGGGFALWWFVFRKKKLI